MTRGPYEVDEPRVPLTERTVGEWTAFEAQIFNLVSRGDRAGQGDAGMPKLLFSSRLQVAQAMLQAYDEVMQKRRQKGG